MMTFIYIITVVVIIVLAIFVLVTWRSKFHQLFCRKKIIRKDEDIHDIMWPTKSCDDHFTTIGICPQRDISVSSIQIQSSSCLIDLPCSMSISSSSMCDRSHVIGASSSPLSRIYPINPPPSPVTVHSQCVHSHWSLDSYKHYHSRKKGRSGIIPPPPTPTTCSTVSDDSCVCVVCSSDIIPPPPTPRSPCLSDENFKEIRQYPDAPPLSSVPPNIGN